MNSDTNFDETTPQAARTRAANPSTPTAEQLIAQRATHWHQAENPLLSMEAMREWLQRSGLVQFTPKPQLGAPAPSLVEATLGKANATPALGDLDAAKSLLARLISEGSAVPLNLLGVTGGVGTDQPDFVVSAAVFSYIFTLRGNKAWKLSPVTSGPVKVSPLALAAYEILSAKVTLSAYDLTTQLGKEVTEAAVLRSLTELWSQLRVIPVPQQDGTATLWELASSRFTKQIKAGANAGQPSALSALISLYLAQAVVATEDEIESFLSPLAPRSRVRDVVHALMSARQLETLVIDGKTLLHVGGDLPAFAAIAKDETEDAASSEEGDGSRISKFAAKPGSKIGTGLRSKPAFGSKPSFGSRPSFGKKPFGAKPSFGGDRERRPFRKDDRGGFSKPSFSKPSFDKPWQENRPAAAEGEASGGEFTPAPRTFERRPDGDRPRPSFTKRPSFGDRGNGAGDSRPPRREFTPREGSDGPRRTFSKPGTFGRKREGFTPSAGGDSRPPRRDFAGSSDRGERPSGGGFKRPGSYSPRPSGGFGGPPRSDFAGKPSFGAKPGFSQDRPDRGEGGDAPRKVFRKFDAPRSPKPFGSKPSFGSKPAFGSKPSFGAKPSFGSKPSFGAKPSFGSKPSFGARPSSGPRPFDSDRPKRSFDGSRPERSDRPRPEGRPSFGSKPGAFKKPFSKPGGFAGGGGPFAKFADGAKPFRKPGQPRKPSGGGYKPTRRKDGQ